MDGWVVKILYGGVVWWRLIFTNASHLHSVWMCVWMNSSRVSLATLVGHMLLLLLGMKQGAMCWNESDSRSSWVLFLVARLSDPLLRMTLLVVGLSTILWNIFVVRRR